MRFRGWLLVWIQICGAAQIHVDSVSFLEDSLVISITKHPNALPAEIRLTSKYDCTEGIDPTNAPFPTEWLATPPANSRHYTWVLPPGALLYGFHCIAIEDAQTDTLLTPSQGFWIQSRALHQFVSWDSLYPWTLHFQRPAGVPWSHIQLIARDQDSSELILQDLFTQQTTWSPGDHQGAWITPGKTLRIRIANAAKNHEAFTQKDSWISRALTPRFDTLPAPVLSSPGHQASLQRTELSQRLTLIWEPVSQATWYQVALLHQQGNQWVLYKQTETPDSAWSVSTINMPEGSWKWQVSARNSSLQSSRSVSSEFELDKQPGRQRTLRIVTINNKDTIPVRGAVLFLSPWNRGDTQILRLGGHQHQTTLRLEDGALDVRIEVDGYPSRQEWRTLHATDSLLTFIVLAAPPALVQGTITDSSGLAVPLSRQDFRDEQGKIRSVSSNQQGTFQIYLPTGQWLWSTYDLNGTRVDSSWINISSKQTNTLKTRMISTAQGVLCGYVRSKVGQGIPRAEVIVFNTHDTLHTWTNAEGYYRLPMAQGLIQMQIKAINYLTVYAHDIILLQYREQSFTLSNGSLRAIGSVRLTEEAELEKRLEQPAFGAKVKAFLQTDSSVACSTTTDAAGSFELLFPQKGIWLLTTHIPGHTSGPDTLNLTEHSVTVSVDIRIDLEARVEGQIITPSTLQCDSLPVLMLQNDSLFKTTWALRENDSTWFYRFRDISPGNYQIQSRYPGYIQKDTVQANVLFQGSFQGRGTIQASPVRFKTTTTEWTIQAFRQGIHLEKVPAKLHLLYPLDTIISLPQTIAIGAGTVRYHIIPDSGQWLPLWNQTRVFEDNLHYQDSVLFPAYHYTAPQISLDSWSDSIYLALDFFSAVDSTKLWILDSAGQKKSINQKKEENDQILYSLVLPSPQASLTYWFEAYTDSGQTLFSNQQSFYRYHSQITAPASPFSLYTNLGDTLRTLDNVHPTLQLSALTLESAPYHAYLQAKGSIQCQSSDKNKLTLQKINALQYQLNPLQPGQAKIQCQASIGSFSDQIGVQIMIEDAQNLKSIQSLQLQSALSWTLSGSRIPLQATVTDSSGQSWQVPATWSWLPENAAGLDTTYAYDSLQIAADFLGPLQIIGSYEDFADTLEIDVQGLLEPMNHEQFWIYDSSLQISLPDSAWKGRTTQRIALQRISDQNSLHASLDSLEICGSFWNLRYDLSHPIRSPRLEFRIDHLSERSPQIMRLDSSHTNLTPLLADSSALTKIQILQTDTSLIQKISRDGKTYLQLVPGTNFPETYGLVSLPQTTKPASLHVVPNPFSPYVIAQIDGNEEPGTSIRFTPSLAGHSSCITLIEVYTLSGEPVRTLIDNQILRPNEYRVMWDGTTNSGNMTRNGRYLIFMTLKTSAKGRILKRIVKPVVVFK